MAKTTRHCGFIGLGNLGVHLAGSLIRAGHKVTVHDLNQQSAVDLITQGARWAESVSELAQVSDVVFTCLPSPQVIDSVVAGENGLLSSLTRGKTWIDMSTNDQVETLRLGNIAISKGLKVLEAPVTGGVHKAAQGDITVLVGGDKDVFGECKDLLSAVGQPIIYVGPLGSAAVIKVITNMLAFIHLVACGEALMLAKQGGIDLGVAFDVIKNSSGNSFVHETEGQLVLNGSYDVGFTMDLALKDLGFATGYGRKFGVPLELAALVENIFVRATAEYGGGAWSTQVVKLLEDALGTDLRAPGFPAKLQ